MALLELVWPVLQRALAPFPKPVRTPDALHLASTEFLRERQPAIRLATYESRQATAAKAVGLGCTTSTPTERKASPARGIFLRHRDPLRHDDYAQ